LTEFFSKELSWFEPLADEREPEYTARVLAPQVMEFIASLRHRSLQVRADGAQRPLPVLMHGQAFYPDIAIADIAEREVAIEVKLLSPESFSDGMTKAIGQAVTYRSGGYRRAHVVLVSKTGAALFSAAGCSNLNSILKSMGLALHLLHA
jgi:hypothetical protein